MAKPPSPYYSYSQVLERLHTAYSSAEAMSRATGLKPSFTSGRFIFFDKVPVDAYVQAKEAQNPKPVAPPSYEELTKALRDNTSEMEALRQESAAAFNLIMDELSKLKCQLVELAPTMPLPPRPPPAPTKG